MRETRCVFACALLLACASTLGCSASSSTQTPDATTFATAPIAAVTSASGAHTVTVFPATTGIVQGIDSIEFVVTDAASGSPVDGLTLGIVPWMPAMGHGSSVVPSVRPMGDGAYVATNVVLFMPGTWELRTSLATDDSAVVTLDVP